MLGDEYLVTSIFYNWLVEPFLREIKEYIVEICREKEVHKVVDICCGTGTQCHKLACENISCYGIDLSPGMLKVATREKPENAHFISMDARNLAFRDGSFELAIISFALHEKSYQIRKSIAREMIRVVKKGGSIVIADYMVTDGEKKINWKVNMVERMAGSEHFRNFMDFCTRGGLLGLRDIFGLPTKFIKKFHSKPWGVLFLEKA